MSEKLAEKSWNVAVRAVGSDELEIAVYDTIGESFWGGGVVAKDILAKLRSSPTAKKVSLRVNSLGGVVDEAKAMHNLLAERAAKGVTIEATVDGIAASAASYLLTAASKVIMPANAFMMLHGVRGGFRGTASDLEAGAALMRRLNDQLAEAYSDASLRRGVIKSKDEYLAEFAKGDLYLDADEAIAWGLADEKLAAVKVAACLADFELLGDDAPSALTSAPYLARAAVAPVTASAIAAATPPVQPSPPRSTGQENPKKTPMTEDELLAQFPAVHASILTKGMEAERKRVNAHLKMAKTCGAMDVAEKAIASGLSIRDEEVFADYQTAAINRRDQANRQADSDDAGAAVAAAKTGAGAPAGAPGAAAPATAAAGEDGEDPELLVAAADIFCGPRKTNKGKA